MLSAAFKMEFPRIYEVNKFHFPPNVPNISFVGRIHTAPQQNGDDCLIEVYLFEYNSFNFADKGRMNIKMQVVYDAGHNSRFEKISSKLQVGKLIFISGLLDLTNDDESPFVEAKEIDILDEFVNNSTKSYNSQSSLFSRTNKFRNSKNTVVKKEKTSDYNTTNVFKNEDNENSDVDGESENVNTNTKDEIEINNQKINESRKKYGKRKLELADLPTQRLKKGKNVIVDNGNKEDNETEEEYNDVLFNQETNKVLKKDSRRKTRSQKK